MSDKNGGAESIGNNGSSTSDQGEQRSDSDQEVMSTFTWSQYTSVDSPGMTGGLMGLMEPSEQHSSQEDSNRARGHGEPPEEIMSTDQEEAIQSDRPSHSWHTTDAEGMNGRLDTVPEASEGVSEWEMSPQDGATSSIPEHQVFEGELPGLVNTPQQSEGQSPSYHSEDDREDEEQHPQQYLTPDQTQDQIMGNGPVPLNRGNIGESLGTERDSPNGI